MHLVHGRGVDSSLLGAPCLSEESQKEAPISPTPLVSSTVPLIPSIKNGSAGVDLTTSTFSSSGDRPVTSHPTVPSPPSADNRPRTSGSPSLLALKRPLRLKQVQSGPGLPAPGPSSAHSNMHLQIPGGPNPAGSPHSIHHVGHSLHGGAHGGNRSSRDDTGLRSPTSARPTRLRYRLSFDDENNRPEPAHLHSPGLVVSATAQQHVMVGDFDLSTRGLLAVPAEHVRALAALQHVDPPAAAADLFLHRLLHRDPDGVEVWDVTPRLQGVNSGPAPPAQRHTATVYARARQDHCTLFVQHLRFLMDRAGSVLHAGGGTSAASGHHYGDHVSTVPHHHHHHHQAGHEHDVARLTNAFFTARRLCVLTEPFEHGELLSLLRPGHRGPLPDPLLSIVTRSVLRVLHGLQQDGYSCLGLAERGTWWVAGDGRVKTGVTVRFERGGGGAGASGPPHHYGTGHRQSQSAAGPGEEQLHGRAEDLWAVADLYERMADTAGCAELPSREAIEGEIRAVQLRLSVLQTEHAALCAAQV